MKIADIESYFEKPDMFPTNYHSPMDTGKGGYNTDMCLLCLESLEAINPIEGEDAKFFAEDLSQRLKENGERLHRLYWAKYAAMRATDYAASVPLAVSIGAYSSIADVKGLLCLKMFDLSCERIGIKNQNDIECGRLVCWLTSHLLKAGYFGIESMQMMYDLDLYTKGLSMAIDDILAHPLDADYLNGRISEDALKGLSYSELILADVFFYMARVDTAYRPNVLKSPVKSQWSPLLIGSTGNLSDVCFIYGAVASASEHTKPAIPKSLIEETPGFSYIKSLSRSF